MLAVLPEEEVRVMGVRVVMMVGVTLERRGLGTTLGFETTCVGP